MGKIVHTIKIKGKNSITLKIKNSCGDIVQIFGKL